MLQGDHGGGGVRADDTRARRRHLLLSRAAFPSREVAVSLRARGHAVGHNAAAADRKCRRWQHGRTSRKGHCRLSHPRLERRSEPLGAVRCDSPSNIAFCSMSPSSAWDRRDLRSPRERRCTSRVRNAPRYLKEGGGEPPATAASRPGTRHGGRELADHRAALLCGLDARTSCSLMPCAASTSTADRLRMQCRHPTTRMQCRRPLFVGRLPRTSKALPGIQSAATRRRAAARSRRMAVFFSAAQT